MMEHGVSDVAAPLGIAPEEASPEWWRGYGFVGRMSEIDYVLWFRNASYNSSNIELVSLPGFDVFQNNRAMREFELLRQSEFIVENFFKLPNVLRQCVESFAGDESSILHIEAFVRLALMLPALDDSEFDVDGATAWNVTFYFRQQLYDELSASVSDDFNSALNKYLMFYNRDENLQLLESVVPMLALVYGAELVTDVLQQWTVGLPPGSPADFVVVVRNWDSACSQYPIQWIVNVVQGEMNE